MTTLTLDVAASAVRPEPRPDPRAALKYLEASGAVAISIRESEAGAAIRFGKIPTEAAMVYWFPEAKARATVKRARKLAGDGADVETVAVALRRAAADLGAVLTSHSIALERATLMAVRLDEFMEVLRIFGRMLEFTKSFRQCRLAAKARGQGFMSYKAAEIRFRRALIPLLQNGGRPDVGQSFFAQVFGGG
jgi:hypothetical protein